MSDDRMFGSCLQCGHALTIHYYPRLPAPGNMTVCTNDVCDASLAGFKRDLDIRMARYGREGSPDAV